MKQLTQLQTKKQRGQGIVEYAGALIIAMVFVVTMVIGLGPDQMTNVYNTINTNMENMFSTHAANINS